MAVVVFAVRVPVPAAVVEPGPWAPDFDQDPGRDEATGEPGQRDHRGQAGAHRDEGFDPRRRSGGSRWTRRWYPGTFGFAAGPREVQTAQARPGPGRR
jgi:hypothetical protein